MEARDQQGNTQVVFETIIDSSNPPIGVDSVILAESSTGNVRVSCFSGNVFVEREEIVSVQDNENITRKWVRPVSVLDIGYGAVSYIEGYLLHRLSENTDELRRALIKTPNLALKMREALDLITVGEENNEYVPNDEHTK